MLPLLTVLIALPGCGILRLPAIDPTGQGIFLPAPNYTTIGQPRARLRDLQPLFPRVGQPAPCGDQVAPPPRKACSDGLLSRRPGRAANPLMRLGDPGRLIVSPGRVVAPVGSEVIVRTGLCGPDGYFLTQQPVEWTLSQDSVGNLVDVGGDGRYVLGRVIQDHSIKLSSNYAKTNTSRNWEVLTRGNSNARDDVLLRKGEGWVSLTSPVEGASYVTALAPDAEAWDHRRQTVEVQWVDATPEFPAPASVAAGQVHEFTTVIRRASNGTPVEGWIVVYEILDGPPSQFSNGQQTVEVKTNGVGAASATVVPTSQDPGAARIRVLIVRPPMGNSPRFPISQGMTSILWSAAGLSLRVQGPETAVAGGPAVFDIEAANPGDQPARDVRVAAVIPPNLRVVSSAPPGRLLGNRLTWELGTLEGQARRRITLNTEVVRGGDIRLQVDAESADGLKAEDASTTRVETSALQLRIRTPATGVVNELVPAELLVTNLTQQPLTGVKLVATFGEGLRHRDGYTSPLENDRLQDLAPGETRRLPLTFIAVRPGRQCFDVQVSAAGGQVAAQQACVDVAAAVAPPATPPVLPPAGNATLRVRKTGPARMELGETQDYFIEVENTGAAPLTNVTVVDRYHPYVLPREASGVFTVVVGEVRWLIQRIEPGKRALMQVRCVAREPAPNDFPRDRDRVVAVNRVAVTCDQGVQGESQVTTEVFRAGAGALRPRSLRPPCRPMPRRRTTPRPFRSRLSPTRIRREPDSPSRSWSNWRIRPINPTVMFVCECSCRQACGSTALAVLRLCETTRKAPWWTSTRSARCAPTSRYGLSRTASMSRPWRRATIVCERKSPAVATPTRCRNRPRFESNRRITMDAAPRFAILHHRLPPGERATHWDLLLEVDPQAPLAAWALAEPPLTPGPTLAASLAPHRRLYLDYEGPLAPRAGVERGEVSRWASGCYTLLHRDHRRWRVRLLPEIRTTPTDVAFAAATAELTFVSDSTWSVVWS